MFFINKKFQNKKIRKAFEEQGCRFLGYILETLKIAAAASFLKRRLKEIKQYCSSTMEGYVDNSLAMLTKFNAKFTVSIFNLAKVAFLSYRLTIR